MKRLEIYDTTLRDGAQAEGISYSVDDKIKIAEKLDSFEVDYIEGGWPYSNPKDEEVFAYFKKNPLKKARFIPFGSTRHPQNAANKDPNLAALVKASTEAVTIFGKTWDLQVRDVLRVSLEENCAMIEESIAFLKKHKRAVFYDAEHFFDGYKQNPEYAVKTLKTAEEAGADRLILCDTNGGTLFTDIPGIIDHLAGIIHVPLGIHTHNDTGFAVANALAAINAGCIQVHGTINGYGERCGNADLIVLMGILALKMNRPFHAAKHIRELMELSYFISEISNMRHVDNQPYTGKSAFAHKGGVHIDAVLKNPVAYEHIDPETVGNQRRFLVSELAGKSSIVVKAKEMEFDIHKKSDEAKELHTLIQRLEKEGYQFEAAEASFKLLIRRHLKKYMPFFTLLGFRVIVEQRDKQLVSEAAIKLQIQDSLQHVAAEGDGPVNALDNALRKALKEFYPELAKMRLTDFKVRVLDERSGTAAKVRVLIHSQDEHESWITIGVSENIIEAAWYALVDSIEYKLLKEKKPRS